jgi:hypothetical protein
MLTQPFADQVDRCMTYQPSDRSLPTIVVDHPTQMVEDDVLHRRAEQIANAIQRLLNDEEPENPSP